MVMTEIKIKRWIEKRKVEKMVRNHDRIKRFIIKYRKKNLIGPLHKIGVLSDEDVEEIENELGVDWDEILSPGD